MSERVHGSLPGGDFLAGWRRGGLRPSVPLHLHDGALPIAHSTLLRWC